MTRRRLFSPEWYKRRIAEMQADIAAYCGEHLADLPLLTRPAAIA